ncbi:MAG: hypothetical protein IT288_16470 [Bdellovibrionales bacterium]|nr:hypothetical protein [Bdellovibrionales bacterium]
MGKFKFAVCLAIVLGIARGPALAEDTNSGAEPSAVDVGGSLEIKMDALLGQWFFQSHNKYGVSQRGFVVTSDREKYSNLEFPDSEIQRRFNVRIFSTNKENLDLIQSHCGRLALEALEGQKTFVVSVSGLNADELSKIRTGRIVITKGPNGEIIRRRVIELSFDVAKDIEVKCSLE